MVKKYSNTYIKDIIIIFLLIYSIKIINSKLFII